MYLPKFRYTKVYTHYLWEINQCLIENWYQEKYKCDQENVQIDCAAIWSLAALLDFYLGGQRGINSPFGTPHTTQPIPSTLALTTFMGLTERP